VEHTKQSGDGKKLESFIFKYKYDCKQKTVDSSSSSFFIFM